MSIFSMLVPMFNVDLQTFSREQITSPFISVCHSFFSSGDDSEKLDGNDDICVIKNVDAISVERFNESEIDDDEDSENGETISVDHFDRSKSNNDDNDACKAHPKDDEQNFHLGSIDFVPVVEKPNSNIKRAQVK